MASLFLITEERRGTTTGLLMPAALFSTGFALSFSLTHSALFMAYNPLPAWVMKSLSGIYILMVGIFLLSQAVHLVRPWIYSIGGLLLGISFGIIYMPCISPTLSKIFNIAMQPDSMGYGILLSFLYAVGLGVSLTVAALAVIALMRVTGLSQRWTLQLRRLFAALLVVLGILNITGYMVYYKSIILKPFIK